jgi:uncharacterized protein (TIGR02271 family)
MADHNQTNSDIDAANSTQDSGDTEPATKHDVGIGGGLGAVGGAIVGALAGGPIGAIIGAVAGGAVSAGAVDVVDKHDHDYARTADTDTHSGTTATSSYVAGDTTPTTATQYTGPGDYQRTPAATTEADYSNTAPAYADTVASPNVGTDTDRTVQLHEEVLDAHTNQVQTGEVTLRKEVITETKSIDVPVTREEVVIERHAVSGGAATNADFSTTEEVLRVPVMEEQVVVQKNAVVTEEISLGKRAVTETQHVTDTVRREEAYIENPDNVDVLERGASGAGSKSS